MEQHLVVNSEACWCHTELRTSDANKSKKKQTRYCNQTYSSHHEVLFSSVLKAITDLACESTASVQV